MICRGISSDTLINTAATMSTNIIVRPMVCRMRRMSRPPQYWLRKIAPPVQVPKLNRLNMNVTRLACVTAEYAASPRPLTISPSIMCKDAVTSCWITMGSATTNTLRMKGLSQRRLSRRSRKARAGRETTLRNMGRSFPDEAILLRANTGGTVPSVLRRVFL